jgi:hypothetical protein
MSDNAEMIDLANRVTRSTVAVIDTVAARGGFRGEELGTIGQLRDQCIALIQLVEAAQGVDGEEGEATPIPE